MFQEVHLQCYITEILMSRVECIITERGECQKGST